MTILKGAEIDRYIAAPEDRRPIVLVYGPDSGLVSERARAIAGKVASDLNDPFTVTRLDGDVLASDPARLADEAGTVPMFGGRRLIWVRAGEKPIAAAVSPLLAETAGAKATNSGSPSTRKAISSANPCRRSIESVISAGLSEDSPIAWPDAVTSKVGSGWVARSR